MKRTDLHLEPSRAQPANALRVLRQQGVPETFVRHVAGCCTSTESALRQWLAVRSMNLQFTLQHDDYAKTAGRPHGNLLATRGDAHVVLVAHTDTCREHGGELRPPRPCLRKVVRNGSRRWILQDKDCQVQLGADDRLGVAIATWVAATTTAPLGLLFTTDEEIGLRSAREVPLSWGDGIELFVQIDRGAEIPQLVTSILGIPLCSAETQRRLLALAERLCLPREVADGRGTDVFVLRDRGVAREAVNLTCGYHRTHGVDEYVDLLEAWETVLFVHELIGKGGRG